MQKELILMRGASGSGKTTRAKGLLSEKGGIYSTDNYFLNESGNYVFDKYKLAVAHRWNQDNVFYSMDCNTPQIIVDNTNSTYRDMAPYIKLAKQMGYSISMEEPQTEWWKKFRKNMPEDELIDLAHILTEKTTHNVSFEVILRMLKGWEHIE